MGQPFEMAGRTVVVVDDDSSLRRLLSFGLQRLGWRVVLCGDAAEALHLLHDTHTPAPDAIVVDAILPDLHGVDLAERLVAHVATASVPILFLSGSLLGAVAREAGIGGLAKPAGIGEVDAALRALIAPAQGAGATAERRREVLRAMRGRLLV